MKHLPGRERAAQTGPPDYTYKPDNTDRKKERNDWHEWYISPLFGGWDALSELRKEN
ncbi:hypothetical protein D3C81_2301770 [compost metagenome]